MRILTIRQTVALGIVVLLLIGILTGGLWLWRDRFFEEMGWVGILVALLFAIGLVPALGVLRPHRHRGIIVLLCRRFGTPDTRAGVRNRWMHVLVSEACRGFAHPVTLQDASIQGSQSVGRSIQNPLIIIGLILGILLWLALTLLILDRIESKWLEGLVILGGLALYIGMLIGIGRLAIWMTTSFAAVRVNPEAIQRKLRAKKRHHWAWREMEVVRCMHDDWQDCIKAMLDEVDLVIIDRAESTEHLSWEIELSQNRLGNERVLLFSPDGSTASNGLQSSYLPYNPQRAHDEIEVLSQEWGQDVYSEGKVNLGSYGHELASQLRAWMEKTIESSETEQLQ